MDFPFEIREYIERLAAERGRELSVAAAGLSERYRTQSGTGKPLTGGESDILAYAAVRMPATFGAAAKALELSLGRFGGEIGSVLDVGAGTGAASLAAMELTDCARITCIERESGMISLGERLLKCHEKSGGVAAEWIRRDIVSGIEEHADLVISAYCLNEMTGASHRIAVSELWRAADKLLVIIEPGTPEGFSRIKAARDIIAEAGGFIIAPCPAAESCPIEEGDWCHFTARIARSRLHKRLKGGDVPYEDEKFSFIAASRTPCAPCGGRILRHPKTESGRITLRLCTADGIRDETVTRKSPLFKAARKSECGAEFDL